MGTIRKILYCFLLIAFAFNPMIAKPVDRHMATHAIFKPLSTLGITSRPVRSKTYLSPGGHFLIHYDNSGYRAVPQDYTYNDSIPDFVFKAAEYLDESYSTLHDSLGFDSPPMDDIESPELDIYFYIDDGNSLYYGLTEWATDPNTGDNISFLSLSTLLNDSTIFYTYGLDGLSVTCAHELFHMFQLGYKFRSSDVFYFEMSSVWFEEYMYPDVNDYHQYFNDYVKHWNYKINDDRLWYNNVGFNFYIDKRFSTSGDNIIHDIWERILSVNALSAIRNELEDRDFTLEEALRDWGTAQVLCGPYATDNFLYSFHDASALDAISFDNYSSNIINGSSASITPATNPMASYFKITGLPDEVMLFDATFDDGATANLICLNGTQSEIQHIQSSPIVIDGRRFDNYIIVVGTDAYHAAGTYAFTSVVTDRMASLYPNPLHPSDVLHFSYVLLENNTSGQLAIYDLKGRKVFSRSLEMTSLVAGLHEDFLVPQNLSSGVYILALHLDNSVIAEKFTYLK